MATTVREWRNALAQQLGSLSAAPETEAERWICRALRWSRASLYARMNDTVTGQLDTGEWERRLSGEPLAYVWGHEEFFGLKLQVTPHVLIPRPDTETLVERALDFLHWKDWPEAPRVLDLGTGSGAIALAIRHEMPNCTVVATDYSPKALATAQANARDLAIEVEFRHSDWWSALSQKEYWDLIVSNPPYIAPDDEHLQSLQHEPQSALISEENGLADLRTIIFGATERLRVDGRLIVEHGHEQGADVRALFTQAGFHAVESTRDYGDNERVTEGVWA